MIFSLYPDHLDVLIILLPSLVFSLCFHEFSHGYIAYRLGDHTAARNGRLTLNPLAHLDPIGSLMILFVGFGWAKPVPVNPYNLSNPRRDMMIVAAAGPLSNLLLAFIGGIIFRIITNTSLIINISNSDIIIQLTYYFIYINIALAVFNLIPIPPLDGSQIFSTIIGKSNPQLVTYLNSYGPQVLFGLIIMGYLTGISVFSMILTPFISLFLFIFAGI